MKRLVLWAALCHALVLAGPAAAEPSDPSGAWEGAIELPNVELAIAVTLARAEGGAWTGTIDVPAQGLSGFALAGVEVGEGAVRFVMPGIPGEPTFEGELAAGGDALAGTFRQGGQSFPFALARPRAGAAAEDEPPAPPAAVPGEGLAGEWLGTLDTGAFDLRVVLRVEEAAGGAPTATLDSVDQGAVMPVDALTLEERAVRFAVAGIGAAFAGTMSADGSAIAGVWTQAGRELPLTLRRLAEPFALARPQEPRPPFPYDSREVAFPNEAAGIRLAGTLAVPRGDGPFPAVLLVTGSGPQDRDESLMGHEPFLVLADHLARRGIASLRFDDRGVGSSEGSFAAATFSDLASDAAAGVAFLAAQKEIVDRDALGVVGHSEGGLSAPRVATRHEEVDFLVLLAPPGVPMESVVLRQARDTLRWRKLDDALIERAMAEQAATLAVIRGSDGAGEELAVKLRKRAESLGDRFSAAERALLGLDPASLERQIAEGTTPWFRSLLREDPALYLRQLGDVPVLALFGGKDVQVPAEVHAPAVEAALAAAGNRDVEVRVLPDLNHLFQHAGTGSPAEYGTIEETFAPEALDLVADWVAERFQGRSAAIPQAD